MKKIAFAIVGAVMFLTGIGAVLYLANSTPKVRPISAGEAANPSRPFVVKLHARWCPICMATMVAWGTIQDEYSDRVNFLVFDYTDDRTTEASRVEAARLGLTQIFEEAGATGVVLVVDGRTKNVRASMDGFRTAAAYRAPIDAALRSAQ